MTPDSKRSPIEHHIEDTEHPWWLRGLRTGRVLGKHSTRKEALAQLRAVERSIRG